MPKRIMFGKKLAELSDHQLAKHILQCMDLQADLDAEREAVAREIMRRVLDQQNNN